MAQIHSENIIITLSALIKDNAQVSPTLANEELKSALEAVAQELAGAGVIVEVQVA